MATTQPSDIHQKLYTQYDKYKEKTITHRRFKHQDIMPLVANLKRNKLFETQILGQSVEGRDIPLIKIGTGNIKILLWSQMHGDEPTATMAMLDIFNFFNFKQDDFKVFKEQLLQELTIYFIPMLNPDGAENYQRRNAQDIDLNRDALRTQTPEGKILKAIQQKTQADFGFNLHDQSKYYTVGNSPNPATLSFLAPAFNYEKEVNPTRLRSMQVIVHMNKIIQAYLPDHVAKYSDDFEPRAFGDNIQKWGTSTILIEAGGLRGDPEKQQIRKLHFVSLLSAFEAIATQAYQENTTEDYFKIPDNERYLKDLIIRKATTEKNGRSYQTDVAFKIKEREDDSKLGFYKQARIDDLGDLSTYYGYEEFNANSFVLLPGKTYYEKIRNAEALKEMDLFNLLKKGYTDYEIITVESATDLQHPLVRLHKAGTKIPKTLAIGKNPSLLLRRSGIFKYAIINGVLIDLEESRD